MTAPKVKQGDLVRLGNGTALKHPDGGESSWGQGAPRSLYLLFPKALAFSASMGALDPAMMEEWFHFPGGVYGIYLGPQGQWAYHSGTAGGDLVYGHLSPEDVGRLEVVRAVQCEADREMILKRLNRWCGAVAIQEEGDAPLPSAFNSLVSVGHAFKWSSVRGAHIRVDFLNGMATHHGVDLGDGRVAHYTNKIRCDPLAAFLGKGTIILTARPNDDHHADEILARAMSRVGEQAYSCILNNCEHYSHWCFSGEDHVSHQYPLVLMSCGRSCWPRFLPLGQVSKWMAGVGTVVGAAVACSLGSGLGVLAGIGGAVVACPTGALLAHTFYLRKAVEHTEQVLTRAICQKSQSMS